MTITDLRQQMQSRKLQSYYIFTGDEIEIQRIYINKVAEIMGYDIIRPNCIADVWNDIISPSIFDTPSVFVIRDDKDLMQNEKLQAQLTSDVLGKNIVIHLVTNVDKRLKWYKANSDKIILFEHLTTDMLVKYAKQHITLNRANFERLIAICENDYSRLLLEIDKIKKFIEVNTGCNCDEVFERFVEDGTIYVPAQDAIFDLVDAILTRNIQNVYNLLYQSYAVGEANMVILSVLYNNAKQILQVQACESQDVCKSTGLTSWQVKCAKNKLDYYSIGELVDMLRLIQKIQKGIITGQIADEISVEYLLVNIL